MQGVEYNFDICDVDSLFEAMQSSEAIPDFIKRKLFFMQSD